MDLRGNTLFCNYLISKRTRQLEVIKRYIASLLDQNL